MKPVLIGLAVVVLIAAGVLLQRRLVMPEEPAGLGARDGRLAPCPGTPNCVSSFAEDADHRVEPLALDREPSAALATLEQILGAMPRTAVVDVGDGYLRAEATSRIFGYVDDLEVLIDPGTGKIHFRSASRTGYSDLGVNRKRVQDLARAFARAGGGPAP